MKNNLVVNHLFKKYDDFELKDICFEIPKGVIVGFIGENGAGKTTTIKSILNLIHIDSGDIQIFGKSYYENEKEIKENIGVVLDDSFFSGELFVRDINKVMKKIHKRWDEKLFLSYMDDFSLSLHKKIGELSTGMLMKLKIATAMSHHAKLLILDEPTSGLDPVARREILDLFRDFIQDEEHSILLSTHITSDLEHIADYIVFIDHGEILLNKSRDELLDTYAIARCSFEEFEKIDKKDFIKFKKEKYECDILVKDRRNFKKKYDVKIVDKPTIEDIMVLMIKGDDEK